MSDKNTGGPAFPTNDIVFDSAQSSVGQIMKAGFSSGMTLRDYLASKAMAVLLGQKPDIHFEPIAERSYAMADAMLAERNKP